MTDNIRAALLMMGALAMLALNDAAIKALALTIPLFQLIVLRNGVTTLALAFSLLRGGRFPRLSRRDLALSLLRGVGEVGAAYFYLVALVAMPFANVVAILQSAPLVVTLAAALFLREPVGWRRLLAILVGFVGVLLIVRPGTDGFDIFAIDVLISVGFITLRDLATRRLSREAPAMTVTAITSAMVLVAFILLGLDAPWVPMTASSIFLTLIAAGFVLASYLTTINAMRIGEISFVSPFRYTSLLWALLLGFVLFGEWPQPMTLLGAAVVVASGLFTIYRERKTGHVPGRVPADAGAPDGVP